MILTGHVSSGQLGGHHEGLVFFQPEEQATLSLLACPVRLLVNVNVWPCESVCVFVCVHLRVWGRGVLVLGSDGEEVGEVSAAGDVRRQVDERVAVLGQRDLSGFWRLLADQPPRC